MLLKGLEHLILNNQDETCLLLNFPKPMCNHQTAYQEMALEGPLEKPNLVMQIGAIVCH